MTPILGSLDSEIGPSPGLPTRSSTPTESLVGWAVINNYRRNSGVVGATGPRGYCLARRSADRYSVPEGDSYSIRVGDAGADPGTARVVCKSSGLARRFLPDGRFLLYSPEVQSKPGPSRRKLTVRLLELASGGDRPWLEHPTESVLADSFGEDGAWFDVRVGRPDNRYIVPLREEPAPVSEWLEAPTRSADWEPAPPRNSFYIVQDRKLMGAQFDSKTRTFGQPFEVKFPPDRPFSGNPMTRG